MSRRAPEGRGRGRVEESNLGPLAHIRPGRVRVAAARLRSGRLVSLGGDGAARLKSPVAAPDGVVTRFVLIDAPGFLQRAQLEPAAVLGPEIFDLAAEREGVIFEPGDALLLRAARRSDGREAALTLRIGDWLVRRQIALLASDAVRVRIEAAEDSEPPSRDASEPCPGLLGSGLDLEPLLRACAADGEYAGLLVLPPFAAGEQAIAPLALR